MEDYIPKPKTIEVTNTSAAKETYKQGKGYNGEAKVDPQTDKIESSIGAGKEFDALVHTLKMAIERGDIDKENVHRLAHGLGIKPDTLASMVGVDSKENIQAEDQDESPKDEVSPPDVSKNFKDFRSEIDSATSVTEENMSAKKINQIRSDMRRSGASSSEINTRVNELRRLSRSSGGRTSVASAGKSASTALSSAMHDPQIQRRMKLLRTKTK
jgi:hypothetical protein